MRKTMTPAQFAAAAVLARLSTDRTAVARSVLVDGSSYSVAVAPYGWSRQAAYGPVKSIRRHWELYQVARSAEAEATNSSGPQPDDAP